MPINKLETCNYDDDDNNLYIFQCCNIVPVCPLQLDDSALQVYKDGDYGPYLDLESSLSEQQEELEGFHKK